MQTKAPGHTEGRIYWHKEGSRAFVLCGYCPDTLNYFLALYEWAWKSFPALEMSECICGKIRKSDSVEGFTFVSFPVPGEQRNIPNFDNFQGPFNFSF